MARAQVDTLIRHLRRAVLRQEATARTDSQLLGSFIDKKDEAAFETLARRHGPMVFGVCRRVVSNHHDAEDAFQATFLVLALKASSVKPREGVANWLHGVALRTAMKAKTMTAKRRGREKQVTEMPEPEVAPQGQWRDLQPLLDQELNGLPENYRLPILLCDLEGKTIKEATQQLGWPQGTLAGRLARGRKLLAKRLANRGVVLSAGALAAVVSPSVASAGVPASLMRSTVKAATLITAGQAAVAGVVPVQVLALMEGVTKSMTLTNLKTVMVLSVLAFFLCGFASVAVGLHQQDSSVPAGKNSENKPDPGQTSAADADRITGLLQQLGHDKFAKREAATAELAAIGEPALRALRKAAAAGADEEIRQRAAKLIATIAHTDSKSAPPPKGAIVLFDGKSLDAWVARDGINKPTWVLVDGGAVEARGEPLHGDIRSKQTFAGSYKLHVEFRVPTEPADTPYGRGNSGVYVHGRYEVQILDSYGPQPAKGIHCKPVESCGAIFGQASPSIKVCKAPGFWQCYDIEFHPPRFQAGDRVTPARMTVYHNGALIHDEIEIPVDDTGQALPGDPSLPGPVMLQYLMSPVQFRNIWVLPLADS
jgi:RNA polymerase sigma factor (sigma-70 family)